VLTSIKTASVKKILSELKNIAANDKEKYAQFIAEYNRPLKEGLYGDYANRETLLDLVRFKSTKVEGLTSLAEAKERMQEGQKALYYITGGAESMLRNSPLLEIYKKKDIEVLILDDDIDEIVFSGVDKYGEIDLKAVNKVFHRRRPQGRICPKKPEKSRGAQASAREDQGHAGRRGQRSARLLAPRRQPLCHRVR
jgi:molecular chaperone HtpG